MKIIDSVKNERPVLLLIDGHGVAYRSFYAMPDLTDLRGNKVGAVYGFLNMLLKLLDEFSPDYLAVSFDKERPKERLNLFADYKAGRDKTPEDLTSQFGIIFDLLDILKIPVEVAPDHEADDCLATIAKDASLKGVDVFIATGDKDLFQMLSPTVKVIYPKKGFSEFTIYDEKLFYEKYGFSPSFMSDYKALAGDSSDNIPGARGIGDVTARKLVGTFGDINAIYDNLAEIAPKTVKLLEESKANVIMSKRLAVLFTDLPLSFDPVKMHLQNFDENAFLDFLKKLGFRSVIRRFSFSENTPKPAPSIPPRTDIKINDNDFYIYISEEKKGEMIIYYQDERIDLSDKAKREAALRELAKKTEKKRLCGFDLKRLFKEFLKHEVEIPKHFFDLAVAYYICDPSDSSGDFRRMYEKAVLTEGYAEELLPLEALKVLPLCVDFYEKEIENKKLSEVFSKQELPLIAVLARIENEGVYCDASELEKTSESLSLTAQRLENQIFEITGEKFNINSPKQLGEILFDKLRLPSGKKRSTAYETLQSMIKYSPVVSLILDYREVKKLQSTYADKLPELTDTYGIIRSNLSSIKTATGRLASSDPNLQNIPARSSLGQEIRKAFKPREAGSEFLSADYSQIELRLLAHFAEDEKMIRSFKEGLDIHTTTSAEIFEVPFEEVTPLMRRKSKEINFGILYGMSAHRLSNIISVDYKQAKEYIERYFARFPDVRVFIDTLTEKASDQGYVTTLMGRKRWFPDLTSRNFNLRSAAQRAALNTVLQGSAADIIKYAMINISPWLTQHGGKTKMILQIHDELLFEGPYEEFSDTMPVISNMMIDIKNLRVPLEVNFKRGKNWAELESIADMPLSI